MIFGLLYFCVVILCVNRSRSSFILYRIVKRHSRQSNVRRIWTCPDNAECVYHFLTRPSEGIDLPQAGNQQAIRKKNGGVVRVLRTKYAAITLINNHWILHPNIEIWKS